MPKKLASILLFGVLAGVVAYAAVAFAQAVVLKAEDWHTRALRAAAIGAAFGMIGAASGLRRRNERQREAPSLPKSEV